MQQRVRSSPTPERHYQCIRDKLGVHFRLYRPADDAAKEEFDDGRNVKPALGCPDIFEVGNPFAVWLIRRQRPVEHVLSDGRSRVLAFVFR